MYEHAVVSSIEQNGKITVTCGSSACSSCKSSTFCSTKGRSFPARLEQGVKPAIGDTVELYLPPGKTATSSFIALLLPLLLFPVGFYLTQLVSPESSELVKVAFGFTGIAMGFVIARIFTKIKGDSFMPTVTKVIDLGEQG